MLSDFVMWFDFNLCTTSAFGLRYVVCMVAYFCHHLSDNYVDLSDNYVDLSDLYVDLSDNYVDLSENYHHN